MLFFSVVTEGKFSGRCCVKIKGLLDKSSKVTVQNPVRRETDGSMVIVACVKKPNVCLINWLQKLMDVSRALPDDQVYCYEAKGQAFKVRFIVILIYIYSYLLTNSYFNLTEIQRSRQEMESQLRASNWQKLIWKMGRCVCEAVRVY